MKKWISGGGVTIYIYTYTRTYLLSHLCLLGYRISFCLSPLPSPIPAIHPFLARLSHFSCLSFLSSLFCLPLLVLPSWSPLECHTSPLHPLSLCSPPFCFFFLPTPHTLSGSQCWLEWEGEGEVGRVGGAGKARGVGRGEKMQ